MRQVIGIGEIVLDIIFQNERPTAAVPGGSTFNSLISLGRAGIPTAMLSETGNDCVGQRCRDFMEQNGVSSRYVLEYIGSQTPISLAMLDKNNDASYEFYKGDYGMRRNFTMPDICPNDIVLFGSYYALNPIIHPYVSEFLSYAKKRGSILYYDINFRQAHAKEKVRLLASILDNMEMADIVRGSREDFEILFGNSDPNFIYRIHVSYHTKLFIETNGAKNVALRTENLTKDYPVKPCRSISTIGAGDNFNAGLLFALIRSGIERDELPNLQEKQWDELLESALSFASNVCGSIKNYIDDDFAKHVRMSLRS